MISKDLIMRKTAIVLSTLLPIIACATERGGSSYNGGTENFMAGVVPPPSFYALAYVTHFRADKSRDNNGNIVSPSNFRISATAISPRFVWSTPQQVLGGNLVMQAIVPLVNLSVRAGPASDSYTGIGDVVLGSAIAFHHSKSLHSVWGFDLVAPTGEYDVNALGNIGRNYWSFQPTMAVSTIDPAGFNGDIKLTMLINSKNKDTDYRSGNEVYVDYSLGWGLAPSWVVGVGGYVYQQISDDKRAGVTVANNKGRAFAIGPSVKYEHPKGWWITAKLQSQSNVRNRAEGSSLWLKTVVPF
jgi:hypothetical protein